MKFIETDQPISEINLASIDTFMREDLMGCFAKLRAEDPVSWHQHPDSGKKGFWAFVRYNDIIEIILDTETFTSSDGIQVMFEEDMPHASQHSMLEMDPPEHSKYRKIVSPEFTPQALAKIEPQIQRRVSQLLDNMESKSDVDFIEDFATPLPMGVFFDLMGVAEADHARVLELAERNFFAADLSFGGNKAGTAEAGREIQEYGRWLGKRRRQDPKDDVMSVLAHSMVDDELLSVDELGSFFGLLGSAGADTTRSSLAFGLDALTMFPEQKNLWLRDIDAHAKTGTDEIIRWTSAGLHMRRTATRDVEKGGREIKKGDKVSVWFVSGNRDEEIFDEPHAFKIARKPNPHMSFGLKGPHFCLGAHLSKLEIRIAFTSLLKRFPGIEAKERLKCLRSNFVNAPIAQPTRL